MGKLTNYKWPCSSIFNSYVKLPEGSHDISNMVMFGNRCRVSIQSWQFKSPQFSSIFWGGMFQWEISRILKWRYVSTIFLAIFLGDIPLHRPEKSALYMVSTSILGSWNSHRMFHETIKLLGYQEHKTLQLLLSCVLKWHDSSDNRHDSALDPAL